MRAFNCVRLLLGALLGLGVGVAWGAEAPASKPDLRPRIEAMKANQRGPFEAIRWFCKDGQVLPPKPSACKPFGGGEQYGVWTPEVKALREQGYYLANILAEIDTEAFLNREDRYAILGQILVEQFLIAVDDGWILRKARSYRGAFQSEAESKAAERLLEGLSRDARDFDRHFLLLRTATALLPHGKDSPNARKVRQLAADLAARDSGFLSIKNKIHARPEPADAATVRAYGAAEGRGDFATLATAIDALYAKPPAVDALEALVPRIEESTPSLSARLQTLVTDARAAQEPYQQLEVLAEALLTLRQQGGAVVGGRLRVALLDVSRALEDEFFRTANQLLPEQGQRSRTQQLDFLLTAAKAAYGVGLMSAREFTALQTRKAELLPAGNTLATYRGVMQYLARAPSWGGQWLGFHFGAAIQRYTDLEPKAQAFSQDQLRGGPLFVYAQVLDGLLRDLQAQSGSLSELFGAATGGGLRGLNAGLARGVLKVARGDERVEDFDPKAIYLLPETVSELPPIAGILTAGEGNPLSHVQLLARNLGIPNVGVDARLLDQVRAQAGQTVVVAVSAGGAVRIAKDGPEWASVFAAKAEQPDLLITPDVERLKLDVREPLPLSALRVTDSGATVGPKAAKLGELQHHYPEAVAPGLALPFGQFRALLEQAMANRGVTVWEWMTQAYRAAAQHPPGSPARAAADEAVRAELQAWLLKADPGAGFREGLKRKMAEVFGPNPDSYGVFVRSDTNVEDLAGFTGAGLNLTVPNVVGFDALMESLQRVWASPFTARAFAWRQSHMTAPEHVYTSILLLKTVPSEKSGVLVTRDIDSGDPEWLSVAVNEGIGGAVDGQAAESLRIHMPTGKVLLLADATAATRRVVKPSGGLEEVPVTGEPEVLRPAEITKLITFARELPQRFPAIVDGSGAPTAADVEFAFVAGELKLLQIRPLVESERARKSGYLQELDAGWKARAEQPIDLDVPPHAGPMPIPVDVSATVKESPAP